MKCFQFEFQFDTLLTSFSEGLLCFSHFVSVLKYKIILRQSRQHVNPNDARAQGHPVGGELADGVPSPESWQRANLLTVKWPSVEINTSHLFLTCNLYHYKTENWEEWLEQLLFQARSSDSNENISPISSPVKLLVYCVLCGQPHEVKKGKKRRCITLA